MITKRSFIWLSNLFMTRHHLTSLLTNLRFVWCTGDVRRFVSRDVREIFYFPDIIQDITCTSLTDKSPICNRRDLWDVCDVRRIVSRDDTFQTSWKDVRNVREIFDLWQRRCIKRPDAKIFWDLSERKCVNNLASYISFGIQISDLSV